MKTSSNLFCMAIGMGHHMKAELSGERNVGAQNRILEFQKSFVHI